MFMTSCRFSGMEVAGGEDRVVLERVGACRIPRIQVGREIAQLGTDDALGADRRRAGPQEVLLTSSGKTDVAEDRGAEMVALTQVDLEPRRHIADARRGSAHRCRGVEDRGRQVSAEPMHRGVAERRDLPDAAAREGCPDQRHRHADVHEVEDPPRPEDRCDLLLHGQRELGRDHVVLELHVAQPGSSHVLVPEVES
jgi:hypothetical protein